MKLYNVDIGADIIDYETTKKDRKRIINSFISETEIRILLNVHVLDEGINIPACDSVFITNPSENIHNIVQRMSTCNRIYKGKDKSYIYLWCGKKKSEEILNYINNNTNSELVNRIKRVELYIGRTNLVENDEENKVIHSIENLKNDEKDKMIISVGSIKNNDSKYYCQLCNYKTNSRTNWYNHKQGKKHKEKHSNEEQKNIINNYELSNKDHEVKLLKEKFMAIENERNIYKQQFEETKKQQEEARKQQEEVKNLYKRIEFLEKSQFQKQLV